MVIYTQSVYTSQGTTTYLPQLLTAAQFLQSENGVRAPEGSTQWFSLSAMEMLGSHHPISGAEGKLHGGTTE